MKFSLAHTRDVIGFTIGVEVQAESGESLAEVATEMDGFALGRDLLQPPETQYTRHFPQAGGFTPGIGHVVRVTARNSGGQEVTASDRWTD
jgi:hypothetical protein